MSKITTDLDLLSVLVCDIFPACCSIVYWALIGRLSTTQREIYRKYSETLNHWFNITLQLISCSCPSPSFLQLMANIVWYVATHQKLFKCITLQLKRHYCHVFMKVILPDKCFVWTWWILSNFFHGLECPQTEFVVK